MNKAETFEKFFNDLRSSLEDSSFRKLIVSNRKNKGAVIEKVTARVVSLNQGERLSFTYRHKTKDVEKNFSFEEGLAEVKNLLDELFYDATLFTAEADIYLTSNKNRAKLTAAEPSIKEGVSKDHNRKKNRLVHTEGNIYLKELGILDDKFTVKKNMQDKYRQIEKFIEIADSLVKEGGLTSPLKAADMGCGKGYLSFALYDHIKNRLGINVEMEGVELRKDLVDNCNEIARKAGFDKLVFKQGSIDTAEMESVDMLIALHACDTATDDAIFKGIRSNAKIIICAPCCHKQIRKEMNVSKELYPLLKHGILAQRQAEIITDGIRALILELHGYKTKVFEFISSHHTAKNIMITAVKSSKVPDRDKIMEELSRIKEFYGIKTHRLEYLLK